MGRRLYRLVETRSYRYKQYGPDGSGGSESLPQSKEEKGSDGIRKYHPRLDGRLHRRIVSATTPRKGSRTPEDSGRQSGQIAPL
jgi:hypothetical protein